MKYRFSDLADIPKLQELMGSLYWLTDIAIGIIDVDGTFLFCAGWRGSCTAGPNKSCECLDYICNNLDPVSYTFKQCPTGMLHYACPIVVEGEHMASVYIGQFFTEAPDETTIEEHAVLRGIDPAEYRKSLRKISTIPPMRLSLLLKYLKDLANMLADIGLQRLRQMETMELLRLNEERLQYLSSHDPLTGLLNRHCFEESLSATDTAPDLPTAIMICDLDSLKLVNDTMGHPTGDTLLRTAAKIISDAAPPEATISRIGGDEFAVLLPQTDAQNALEIKRNIQTKVDEHNRLHEHLPLGISVGYAATGDPSLRMRDLFKQADADMYCDKTCNGSKLRGRIMKKYLEEGLPNDQSRLCTDK